MHLVSGKNISGKQQWLNHNSCTGWCCHKYSMVVSDRYAKWVPQLPIIVRHPNGQWSKYMGGGFFTNTPLVDHDQIFFPWSKFGLIMITPRRRRMMIRNFRIHSLGVCQNLLPFGKLT